MVDKKSFISAFEQYPLNTDFSEVAPDVAPTVVVVIPEGAFLNHINKDFGPEPYQSFFNGD